MEVVDWQSLGSRVLNSLKTQMTTEFISLLSNWYSGATLFTFLMNGHSQIVSNGETMFFSEKDDRQYECSCGKLLDECEFYAFAAGHMKLSNGRRWDKRVFVHVPSYSRNKFLRVFLQSWRYDNSAREFLIKKTPQFNLMQRDFIEAQQQFFDRAREFSGASIYMDGTKSLRRAQMFARNVYSGTQSDKMKVIHLIRDGRAFCYSFCKNERGNPSLEDAVRAWLMHIRQVKKFRNAFPSTSVLVVRYEDLCRSTRSTVKRVCEFLGIFDQDVGNADFTGAHILGHEMRKTFQGEIREDLSWKSNLDRRSEDRLTALMRDELKGFEYL